MEETIQIQYIYPSLIVHKIRIEFEVEITANYSACLTRVHSVPEGMFLLWKLPSGNEILY